MRRSVFFRAFEPEDYVLINKWRNDPEIQKMTGGIFRYVSSEWEKSWVMDKIKSTKDMYWTICLNDGSDRMIGYTSINNIDHLNRTIFSGGILIGDKEYRDGITLIDTLIIKQDYVFNELNINRLEGSCLKEHSDSLRMMLMMGLKIEGVKKQAVFKHGKYHDVYICSLLREEYHEILNSGGYEIRNILKRLKSIKINNEIL
ncbi:MAG: GNAT family N-acetyltransferase [Prevotellaceae bacterium]|jgi:RimJ/RimL family protein N-acetyltransferase|nr:GNAT family N-acetyltransferase [Prevotellaceae bacterium]